MSALLELADFFEQRGLNSASLAYQARDDYSRLHNGFWAHTADAANCLSLATELRARAATKGED